MINNQALYKNILFLTISIFVLVLVAIKINWADILIAIKDIKIIFFSFSILLMVPIIYCSTMKWKLTVSFFKIDLPTKEAFKQTLISSSSNAFLPARSGDLTKIFFLKKHLTSQKSFLAIVIDNGFLIISLLLLSLFTSIILKQALYIELSGALILISIGMFLLLSSPLHTKNYFLLTIKRNIKNLNNGGNITKALEILLWSIMIWLFSSLQVYYLFLSLNVSIPLLSVCYIFPMVTLISLLPITIGGLGIRDAAFCLLFAKYVNIGYSLTVSLLYFFCNYLLLLLFTLIYLHVTNNSPFIHKEKH